MVAKRSEKRRSSPRPKARSEGEYRSLDELRGALLPKSVRKQRASARGALEPEAFGSGLAEQMLRDARRRLKTG
jgi:hypothetical protein